MSKSSHDKGAKGEREFLRLVNEAMGTDLKRNLSQYQRSDGDLPDLGGFCIEVRRRKAFEPSWWLEAVEHAEDCGRLPALAYRVDYQREWNVMVYGKDVIPGLEGSNHTVTMPLDAFFMLVAFRTDNPLQHLAEMTAATREAQN